MDEINNTEQSEIVNTETELTEKTVSEVETGKKKHKGLVLFIIACVVFTAAFVIDLYCIVIWSSFFQSLKTTDNNAGQALGLALTIPIFVALWLMACPIPSIAGIVLTSISIKNFKIASIILLVLLSAAFITNAVFFGILLWGGNSSSETAMLALSALSL